MAPLPTPQYSRLSEASLCTAEMLSTQLLIRPQPNQPRVPSKEARFPLSNTAAELLTELYRVVAPRLTAPGRTLEPLSMMFAVHAMELNENNREPRDVYLSALVSAFDELEEARTEWLTPGLQEVKRWLEASPKLAYTGKAIELRINEALRQAGEPELSMPFVEEVLNRSIDPPFRTRKPPAQVEDEQRKLTEILADLAIRKPRLRSTILDLIREFELHEADERR